MELLWLLIGQIQAYIFAVLALVYIASATGKRENRDNKENQEEKNNQKEKN
jgi:F-type H+-transporting ATPase subunit a